MKLELGRCIKMRSFDTSLPSQLIIKFNWSRNTNIYTVFKKHNISKNIKRSDLREYENIHQGSPTSNIKNKKKLSLNHCIGEKNDALKINI